MHTQQGPTLEAKYYVINIFTTTSFSLHEEAKNLILDRLTTTRKPWSMMVGTAIACAHSPCILVWQTTAYKHQLPHLKLCICVYALAGLLRLSHSKLLLSIDPILHRRIYYHLGQVI